MSTETEMLQISQCPKCKNSHKYNLEVQRSWVIYNLIAAPTKAVRQQFTRLFTCPVTGDDYQARFWIVEEPNQKIVSVDVKSVHKKLSNNENDSG